MADAFLPLQQQVDRSLRRAEADLRDFIALLRQPGPSAVQSQNKREKELHELCAKLQDHRAQVRHWTGLLEPRHASRAKLGAMRGRIEQELRRFREQQSAAKDPQQLPGKMADLPASVEVGAPGRQPHEEAEAEVKVLSDQVLNIEEGRRQITEEFICKICLVHLVGCVPRLTRCSHLFCGDCIRQWFAMQPVTQTWAGRAQGVGSVPCPACKEPLDQEKDIFPIIPGGKGGSGMLWQLLSRTKILCANNPSCNPNGTCMWQGDYGSYQAHLQACRQPSAASSPSGARAGLRAAAEGLALAA